MQQLFKTAASLGLVYLCSVVAVANLFWIDTGFCQREAWLPFTNHPYGTILFLGAVDAIIPFVFVITSFFCSIFSNRRLSFPNSRYVFWKVLSFALCSVLYVTNSSLASGLTSNPLTFFGKSKAEILANLYPFAGYLASISLAYGWPHCEDDVS